MLNRLADNLTGVVLRAGLGHSFLGQVGYGLAFFGAG